MTQLPPGFRFCPTDEELVLHYLKRKVFFLPLPASTITAFEDSRLDPWNLSGDVHQDRYFFSTKELMKNRTTQSGYWRATGIDEPVVSSRPQVRVGIKRPLLEPQVVVGTKKTLVFYVGKSPNGTPTDWLMHEYRLATLPSLFLSGHAPLPNRLTQANWVLCRISKKEKGRNGIDEQDEDSRPAKKKCTEKGVILNLNEPPVVSPASASSRITGFSCECDSDDESDDDGEECCSCDHDSSQDESP